MITHKSFVLITPLSRDSRMAVKQELERNIQKGDLEKMVGLLLLYAAWSTTERYMAYISCIVAVCWDKANTTIPLCRISPQL